VPDLWFPIGLATGIIVAGFLAVGSFERGAASVRRGLVSAELSARQRAVFARRSSARHAAAEYAPERMRA
jgi:hypothetical protein